MSDKDKFLKLRNEKVTQADFDKLPMLVSRFQFKFFSGLSDHDLDDLRESKQISAFCPSALKNGHKKKKKGYNKYYKTDLAKICGFGV